MDNLKSRILELKEKKDALILAHYYQPMEIQEIADVVGDSFKLAKLASTATQRIIVLCGVYFMAESAKILNPQKTVLIPVADAGCPMADTVAPEQVLELRKKYPEAAVMCYVNSSASTKAVSDICCTSSSAVKIARALPNRQIIFVPDKNLGAYVASKVPEKEIILHSGCCPIHNRVTEADVRKAKSEHPAALFLAHPECPADVLANADVIGSTEEILNYVTASSSNEFIIGTEIGVVDRLHAFVPGKMIWPLTDNFICSDMKKIGLPQLLNCLERGEHEILMRDEEIAAAAISLERMVSY